MMQTAIRDTARAELGAALSLPHWVQGPDADVLASIYQAHISLAVWQRQLPDAVQDYARSLPAGLSLKQQQAMADMPGSLLEALPESTGRAAFVDDLMLLAEMLQCLFDPEMLCLRLEVCTTATCPRFHIDQLGVRAVISYTGPGTQWLPNGSVERFCLGTAAMDAEAGSQTAYRKEEIRQLGTGDFALLKGEGWEGNRMGGLVHRSPQLHVTQTRVFASFDLRFQSG